MANAATMPLSGASSSPAASGPAASGRLPRAMTPVPGDMLLGRYRVKAELGRGAMGVVHHAWDEKLEREVAIKEMADELRAIPEAMQLFVQEAKALAQLNHTNIVAMYDQVTETDKVYMIMEFVDGRPLEAIVRERGVLQWLEAVGIMDQACAGLAYAHARKVIHRDIKPANIFVASDKVVKLGDFGLARVMREVTIRRTEIRGTPLYMAPEQIRGTDVDHRTDLYAVGCTLFELVTGRPPFIEGDILFAQMSAKPPVPSSLNDALPKPLDDLILALLEKQADDRPGSANEVRTTFRDLSSF
jgi:serine/threonine protein kinase